MSDNQRYITKRISEEIPLNLVLFMWSRIDVLKATTAGKLDYLQVFELKEINEFAVLENQLVIHRSEDPQYIKSYAFTVRKPVTTKIYVIDSGPYSTMMFAEEY